MYSMNLPDSDSDGGTFPSFVGLSGFKNRNDGYRAIALRERPWRCVDTAADMLRPVEDETHAEDHSPTTVTDVSRLALGGARPTVPP